MVLYIAFSILRETAGDTGACGTALNQGAESFLSKPK